MSPPKWLIALSIITLDFAETIVARKQKESGMHQLAGFVIFADLENNYQLVY